MKNIDLATDEKKNPRSPNEISGFGSTYWRLYYKDETERRKNEIEASDTGSYNCWTNLRSGSSYFLDWRSFSTEKLDAVNSWHFPAFFRKSKKSFECCSNPKFVILFAI